MMWAEIELDGPQNYCEASDRRSGKPGVSETKRIIRDLSGLDDIRAEWDRIAAAGEWGSPIQHHLWARTYAEVFGAERRLRVFATGSGPSAAIAPLFRPKGLFRSLELIGVEELFEVMDFVQSESSDLDGLARAIVTSRRPVVLRRIRADSPGMAALRRACAREWITFCRPSRGCPYITLDASWSAPEQHVNAGRRSDLRRARRTAEKMGPVTYDIITPAPHEVPELLDQAYRVEAGSWKGREKTALQLDHRLGEFYRRYGIAAAERGMLRVCFLRIGGQPAAMQIAIVTGGRFWLLKIGYSDEYARSSPGVLLMVETIRYAAEAGLQYYEFLGAAEAWIRNWTPLEHACVSFRAYPITLQGVTALARDAALATARRRRAGGDR